MLREGRIANVAAALVLEAGPGRGPAGRMARSALSEAVAATARLLASLFEEVLLVGGPFPPEAPGRPVPWNAGPAGPLPALLAALESTGAERLLFLDAEMPRARADLLLALFAWPEADSVVATLEGRLEPLCAIYRVEPVLARARARLAAGELDLGGLLGELDGSILLEGDLAALHEADAS